MGRKKEWIKEMKEMSDDEAVMLDNSFDSLPEIMDKDYGFFMMFGRLDVPKSEVSHDDSITRIGFVPQR